eukprot:gene22831-biopygen8250
MKPLIAFDFVPLESKMNIVANNRTVCRLNDAVPPVGPLLYSFLCRKREVFGMQLQRIVFPNDAVPKPKYQPSSDSLAL